MPSDQSCHIIFGRSRQCRTFRAAEKIPATVDQLVAEVMLKGPAPAFTALRRWPVAECYFYLRRVDMKESWLDFSLTDFLAYFVPGTVTLVALGAIVRLSPFKNVLTRLPLNLVAGLILIALSYFVGILVSSLTYNLDSKLLKLCGLREPRAEIPLETFHDDVSMAFRDVFRIEKAWSIDHFYLMRSLVQEKMPAAWREISRQEALRQLRRNSIIPVLLLGTLGVYAGGLAISDGFRPLGTSLILFAVTGVWMVVNKLVKAGLYSNRRRAARELCTALLVFHSQGRMSGD